MKPLLLIASLLLCMQLNAQHNTTANTISSTTQNKTMKKFILVMRINPAGITPEQTKDIHDKWDALVPAWKAKGIYLQGNPIVTEGMVVTAKGAEKGAIYDETGRVVSVITIEAAGMDEAVALARQTPLLQYGGSAEVRELPPPPPPAAN
jgi:hypothetical protein